MHDTPQARRRSDATDETTDQPRRARSGGPHSGRSGGKQELPPGTPERIGRYVIEAELGRGGMGVVYRARDERLDRRVALKALPATIRRPDERVRFETEARLVAALEHPNVAAIYGIEEADDTSFLVLQLVDGESLATRLGRGPFPLDEALRVGREIAAGLEAAHQRDIVHCDLKPANVMLTRDGSVRIVDFGIATRWRRTPTDGGTDETFEEAVSRGTPAYMSPEQVRGEAVDPRTDVWAFGCVLLECLTGAQTFAHDDTFGRLGAVLTRDPDWARLPPDTPAAVRSLLERCLAKERDERLGGIGEARATLERVAGHAAAVTLPSTLPRALTTFVGRESEVADVVTFLGKTRLLTLTGAAGCGKTRLAITAADEARPRFPDGAWLAALAPIADPAHVVATVAAAVGVREEPGRSAERAVVAALQDRRGLLVLDNCEHLLAEASRLVEVLLRECNSLVVLCTSREALGATGETSWRVPSLGHPSGAALPPLVDLARFDAVRLFVERAREVKPTFELTAKNAQHVASIIQRLDGIPLAIELAAARVRMLAPSEILARLADRFRLLTGGRRSALERHQTLRAALDWSYDLLGEDERRCLRELSTFSGGFRLEEAAEVCTGDEFEVLDFVSALVDKSLVQVDADGRERTRYRLLESVRQHAATKLEEAGEAADARGRHATCYVALASREMGRPRSVEAGGMLRRLESEHDNLRAALEWTLADSNDATQGLQLATALVPFWDTRGHWVEGRAWLERVVEHPAVTRAGSAWGTVHDGLGRMNWWLGEMEVARSHFAESLAAYRSAGDAAGASAALMDYSMVAHARGDLHGALAGYEAACVQARAAGGWSVECAALLNISTLARDIGEADKARTACEAGLAIAEAHGQRRSIARALRLLGNLVRDAGRFDEARNLIEKALLMNEEDFQRRDVAGALLDLGHVARLSGDFETALALYARSAAACRELGDRRGAAQALANFGIVSHEQGDRDRARPAMLEALAISRDVAATPLVAGTATAFGWLLADEGRRDEAAALQGAASAARDAMGRKLGGPDLVEYETHLGALRAALGDGAFDTAWRRGVETGLDAQVDALVKAHRDGTEEPPIKA